MLTSKFFEGLINWNSRNQEIEGTGDPLKNVTNRAGLPSGTITSWSGASRAGIDSLPEAKKYISF